MNKYIGKISSKALLKNMNKEIEIPEGYKARIEGNKVILERKASEDERIRKSIIRLLQVGGYMPLEDKEKAFAYLEKQKEKNTLSTEETELNSIAFLEQLGYTCVPPGGEQKPYEPKNWPADKDNLTQEQKPTEGDKETDVQKAFREGQRAGRQEVFDNPGAYGLEKIDNVFGFRIGDKVRLADGDGRPHIIKHFEKIEGLHGPNFYLVRFEDNTASDHIIPGDEYPNGYFTCIEKIDEQKEKKPSEWSEEDEEMRNLIVAILEVNHPDGFFKANEFGTTDMRGVHTEEIISWLKSLRPQPHWKPSEEQIEALECAERWYTDNMGHNPALYQLLCDLKSCNL